MSLFDILGPVMVGPSSSHTAGAVRIGYLCRRLLNEPVKSAKLLLYGSFLATARGHGTDRALVAGLLGFPPEDERISNSFELADQEGMQFEFGKADLIEAHPNTVVLELIGVHGGTLEAVAESVGGGRVRIRQIDGLDANFFGDYPTLVVHNEDKPGNVAKVTRMLAQQNINIATMQLYRDERDGQAVMVIECDREIPMESRSLLAEEQGILKVTYLPMEK